MVQNSTVEVAAALAATPPIYALHKTYCTQTLVHYTLFEFREHALTWSYPTTAYVVTWHRENSLDPLRSVTWRQLISFLCWQHCTNAGIITRIVLKRWESAFEYFSRNHGRNRKVRKCHVTETKCLNS